MNQKVFSILQVGIIEKDFQMEGKKCKDQERLKMSKRKTMPQRGRYYIASGTLSGQVAFEEKRLAAAQRNSLKVKGEQKEG